VIVIVIVKKCQLESHDQTSMATPNSQNSQVVWKISEEFCHRLIVVDGVIQCVSSIGCGSFTGSILWLPSPTILIASESVSKKEEFKSVVFEREFTIDNLGKKVFSKTDLKFVQIPASVEVLGESCFWECRSLSSVRFETGSRLSRIEGWAFHQTGLVELVIPASVEFLGAGCFSLCKSLSSVTFETGARLSQIEKKKRHSLKPVWLSLLFLHRLKSWVRNAFLSANHFPLLHLKHVRDCHKLEKRHSLKLV
jgi:hypothetical protein